MPELSIVIPTLRRHDALRRTMAALARQSVDPERFEVIVVDDPAETPSEVVADALRALGRPVVHLHRRSPGASAARNLGWRAAESPAVLFLGDDILAGPELVAEHLAFHQRHASEPAAAIGPVRWAAELRVTPLMMWLEQGIHSDYGRLDAGGRPTWADFLTSNASAKRALIERAGGFDEENFPFLYEDLDLGLRMSELGMELHYLPGAAAEHLHAPTLPEWRRRMADTADAEHRWITLHPELEPYFERRLRPALQGRRAHGTLARALAPLARVGPPRLSGLIRRELDLYYRQQLAPGFLERWERRSAPPLAPEPR